MTQRPRAAAGYTKALESHAYQDAFGTVLYMNQASTNVTYGVSQNGGSSWAVGGSNSVDNKISWASGFELRGPHFSRE
ncbi:hypothetical protein OG394_30580 [Kribbella sp. NBC_01245]|uniref:hypothetical protein n=1 Tax=Kribbella sp. NBC_01245 TaxID=2903578 RepID=UPI002E2CD25F|nr:hypothetical protein [Kribbella sp. NBC_01245]